MADIDPVHTIRADWCVISVPSGRLSLEVQCTKCHRPITDRGQLTLSDLIHAFYWHWLDDPVHQGES